MTKAYRFFVFSLIGLVFIYAIISGLYLFHSINKDDFISIMIGIGINQFNFVLGIIFFKFGIFRSNSVFIISIMGGILIRMLLTLLAVLMSLLFLELKPLSFIFSILFFYFLHLSIEIIYLNLRKN